MRVLHHRGVGISNIRFEREEKGHSSKSLAPSGVGLSSKWSNMQDSPLNENSLKPGVKGEPLCTLYEPVHKTGAKPVHLEI